MNFRHMDENGRKRGRESLLCLAQALVGQRVVIELRNEDSLIGNLFHVDSSMNLELRDVVFYCIGRQCFKLDKFYLHRKCIRMIHVPDCCDMKRLVKTQVAVCCGQFKKAKLFDQKKSRKERLDELVSKRLSVVPGTSLSK